MGKRIILLIAVCFTFFAASAPESTVKFGLVKYSGGGDWYSDPTALPNLISFCNENLGMSIQKEPVTVEVGSPEIYNYPFLHLTGHGNVVFSDREAENLRNYLIGGGFLHIDDNYGLDKYIRPAMKKVFPELEFVELPFSHDIYDQRYTFDQGPPKIHEHEGDPAQGFGLIYKGRLVCYYTYESDLGDGWEDQSVHNNPQDVRQKALRMGANIVQYACSN